MNEEIKQCRFCGIHTEFYVQDIGDGSYRAACKNCGARGPFVGSAGGAIEAWKEMMAPRAHDPIMTFDKDGNVRMLEQERSYRDRLDRIAAAIIGGYISNGTDAWGYRQVAASAMAQLQAIDEILKEKEALDV